MRGTAPFSMGQIKWRQKVSAAKTGIQQRGGRLQQNKLKISEIHVEPGLGVMVQPCGAQLGMVGMIAWQGVGDGLNHQARMGQRVAIGGRIADHEGAGRLRANCGGMDREGRDEGHDPAGAWAAQGDPADPWGSGDGVRHGKGGVTCVTQQGCGQCTGRFITGQMGVCRRHVADVSGASNQCGKTVGAGKGKPGQQLSRMQPCALCAASFAPWSGKVTADAAL